MFNKVINFLFLTVFSLCIAKTSQAQSLPQGCFSGTISNGAQIQLKITKVSKSRYRIIELSDLNFHGAPYSAITADYITGYNANFSVDNQWFVGKQPRANISFSVDGIARVVLTRLSSRKVRYHRVVKQLGASDDFPLGKEKTKGTLTIINEGCAELVE